MNVKMVFADRIDSWIPALTAVPRQPTHRSRFGQQLELWSALL